MKENKLQNIEKFFAAYPILKEIDLKNDGRIKSNAIYKKIEEGKYLYSIGNECSGVLFVISGTIKVQKINEEGSETNLYDIRKGQLCHEALSCMLNNKSLEIIVRAVEDSEVYIINAEIVKNILLKDISFIEYMYKDIYEKLNIVVSNKEKIKYDSVEKRLINFLMSQNSNEIKIKQSEIGFNIDSTRERF